MTEFLLGAKKALVPLVVSGLAVVLSQIGVDLPGDTLQQIAVGIINSVFVYLTTNE